MICCWLYFYAIFADRIQSLLMYILFISSYANTISYSVYNCIPRGRGPLMYYIIHQCFQKFVKLLFIGFAFLNMFIHVLSFEGNSVS